MTRYWQPEKSGDVLAFPDNFDNPGPWTEVKVVPLDAIVIERSELEAFGVELTNDGATYLITGDGEHLCTEPDGRPGGNRWIALAHLALTEYLTANPPVDEAQAQAFAADLIDAGLSWSGTPDDEAGRRMVARGWTKPGVTP